MTSMLVFNSWSSNERFWDILVLLLALDLKTAGGAVYKGQPKTGKSNVTVTIADADFVDLVSGKLSGQQVSWVMVAIHEVGFTSWSSHSWHKTLWKPLNVKCCVLNAFFKTKRILTENSFLREVFLCQILQTTRETDRVKFKMIWGWNKENISRAGSSGSYSRLFVP